MKTTITDRHGNIEQELSYDPWGTRRNPDTWLTWDNQNLEAPMFDRGYTGHEHLYAFGLINMNGRMYDPLTSSFLSVDAYVQSPDNAQSFNRYAYCQNNPLRYVDPSGWYMQGAGHGTHTINSSWGTSYSQHAYEPRELGMLQLPDCSVMTWWMEGETMLGGGGGGGGGGNEYSTPDNPPGSKNSNEVKNKQEDINKAGATLTLIGGAAKITDEATVGVSTLLQTTTEVTEALTSLAILINARINYIRYRNGEISLYSMFARDGMTVIEAAIAKLPYGIGVIPSIGLTTYDIAGGFEQTIYNKDWVLMQFNRLDKHLNLKTNYQPIYYRHGR